MWHQRFQPFTHISLQIEKISSQPFVTTAFHGGAMAASTAALVRTRTNLNITRSRQVTPFPENALEPLEACISRNRGEIFGDMCG